VSRSVRKSLSVADALGKASEIPVLHKDHPEPMKADESTKRVNINIVESKHRLLKSKAAASGKTMTQVLEAAIDRYLSD